MEGVIFNMANKRVFKLATASAVAASALVAAVPASAASVTYEQAEKQVNKAREAANGLHALYTRDADYVTQVDSKEARDELARAKAKIAALSSAKEKAYLSSRIQGTIDTVARANAYNNAVRAGGFLGDAVEEVNAALANGIEDLAAAQTAQEKLNTYYKVSQENFGKVYGKEIQANFKKEYITADLVAFKADAYYGIATRSHLVEADKAIKANDVATAEKYLGYAKASVAKVTAEGLKDALTASWTKLSADLEAIKVPKVESVSAINAKELVVKFNVPMKKSSVIETSGLNAGTLVDGVIKVDGSLADSLQGSLSADGKELTIRAASDWEGTHSLEVIADTLVSTTNKKAGHYTTAFNFDDTVRATITGVEYVDKYSYKVNFSEPVTAVGSETATFADGSVVTLNTGATGYGLSTDGKSFTVAFDPATAANKEITVSFPQIVDFAGNISVPLTAKATISNADQTKPAITSAVSTSPTTVKVKFAETVNLLDATKVSFNGVALTALDVAVDANDATVLNVTVPSTTTSGVLALTAGAVEDLNKNGNAAFSQTVSFAHDKVAPQVTNTEVVRVNGVNNLKVTFSEAVTEVGTTLTLKYTDEYGVQQTKVIPAAKINVDSTDAKVVFIELHDGVAVVKEGVNYSFDIATGFFVDGFQNDSVAKTVSFLNSTSATTSKLALNTTNPVVNGLDANGAFVDVQFADAVNAASATNKANYTIEGATVSNAVLTYNNPTTANGDGAKAVVRVYIADNTVETTGYFNVTVNGVTGYSTSVTQMNSETKNISIIENTRATVTSSSIKSLGASSVVTVNFSEAIANDTVANGDFDLYVDGVKVTAAAVTNGTLGASIDFTINTDLSDEIAAGKAVKLVATTALDLSDASFNVANVKEIVIK